MPIKQSKNARPGLPVSSDDNFWQAQDDARTLMRAEEIRADKSRLNAIKQHSKKLHEVAGGKKR